MSVPALSPIPLYAVPAPQFTDVTLIAAAAVFVVFLFVHIFAVCHRLVTSDGADHAPGRRRVRARLVFVDHPPASRRQKGLGAAAFSLLPSMAFREADFEEDLDCAVCLSKLAEGEAVRLLPQCRHAFHVECIDMWFSSHNICPICRSEVAIDEPKVASSGVDVESAVSSPISSNAPDASVGGDSSSSGSSRRTAEEVVIDIPLRRGNAVDGSAGGDEGVVIVHCQG